LGRPEPIVKNAGWTLRKKQLTPITHNYKVYLCVLWWKIPKYICLVFANRFQAKRYGGMTGAVKCLPITQQLYGMMFNNRLYWWCLKSIEIPKMGHLATPGWSKYNQQNLGKLANSIWIRT
jgi:hypothetical protein